MSANSDSAALVMVDGGGKNARGGIGELPARARERPGGLGQQAMALNLPAGTCRWFADGSFLAELEHLDSAAAVLPTVAAATGVCPQPGEPLDQALIDGLWGKQTLLVLDGCEHLA